MVPPALLIKVHCHFSASTASTKQIYITFYLVECNALSNRQLSHRHVCLAAVYHPIPDRSREKPCPPNDRATLRCTGHYVVMFLSRLSCHHVPSQSSGSHGVAWSTQLLYRSICLRTTVHPNSGHVY